MKCGTIINPFSLLIYMEIKISIQLRKAEWKEIGDDGRHGSWPDELFERTYFLRLVNIYSWLFTSSFLPGWPEGQIKPRLLYEFYRWPHIWTYKVSTTDASRPSDNVCCCAFGYFCIEALYRFRSGSSTDCSSLRNWRIWAKTLWFLRKPPPFSSWNLVNTGGALVVVPRNNLFATVLTRAQIFRPKKLRLPKLATLPFATASIPCKAPSATGRIQASDSDLTRRSIPGPRIR